MDNWIPPVSPEFLNVKDQFIWHLKKFCRFALYCGNKAGISNLSQVDNDKMESVMNLLGDNFLIGKVMEIKRNYGDGLQKGSLTEVSKVVAEMSQEITVSVITEDMRKFTEYLSNDDLSRRRLFLTVDN